MALSNESCKMTEEVAPVPTPPGGVDRTLDPHSVTAGRTAAWIASAIVVLSIGTIVLPVVLLASLPSFVEAGLVVAWLFIAALVFALSHLWPPLRYRYTSYRVDERGLQIRRGVLWRSVTSLPRSRVQHTDVSQGPIERRFGLATLTAHTAGTVNAQISLGGLPYRDALAIRDHLISKDRGAADGV